MYKVVEVADSTLKEDVKSYKKLANKRFSLSVHVARTAIEKRADEILVSFQKGTLTLKPEQYGLFAKYINILGFRGKEEYFDLLQEKADFDVREYAQKEETPWWKRAFSKNNNQGIEYLPAKKLIKMADKYILLHEKMEDAQYGKPWLGTKADKIHADAESYINAYLNDKIKINSEDVDAFKHFIKVMEYPLYEGSDGEKALKKLEKEYDDVLEQAEVKEETKAVSVPLFSRLKQSAQAKLVALKENNTWYRRTAVAIAGFVAVGALWLGFKDDFSKAEKSTTNDKKVAKTEARAQKAETKAADEKMIHFSFVANEYKSTAPAVKPEKTVKKDNVVNYDSARLARINHHNHVLEMRLGKVKGEKLVNDIKAKINDGVFSLPQNLGAEDFAYAMEMYRAYGVKCSLNDAFKSDKKLSENQNSKVVEDIVAAGETGLGVKKMASAMNNGKLNHKSVYNRASKKSQRQHNMNMQQWFKAKKRAARAA